QNTAYRQEFWPALHTCRTVVVIVRHARKVHPVVTTGSRELFHDRDHRCASESLSNWRTFQAQRREHRNNTLLRAGQDVGPTAAPRERSSHLPFNGPAHPCIHTALTRARLFAQPNTPPAPVGRTWESYLP